MYSWAPNFEIFSVMRVIALWVQNLPGLIRFVKKMLARGWRKFLALQSIFLWVKRLPQSSTLESFCWAFKLSGSLSQSVESSLPIVSLSYALSCPRLDINIDQLKSLVHQVHWNALLAISFRPHRFILPLLSKMPKKFHLLVWGTELDCCKWLATILKRVQIAISGL